MRKPQYVSPSSLAKYEKKTEDFYLTYMTDNRTPRSPQSEAAGVGSAFDARVKSNLMQRLYGNDIPSEYTFGAMFEEQVEPQCRDFCRKAGDHAFECYKFSGLYEELWHLMDGAIEPPRFEFTVKGQVNGVPTLGKPDCWFVHKSGVHFVLDWKINGYCSKYTTAPNKGYRVCYTGQPGGFRDNGQSHPMYEPMEFNGIEVNSRFMEETSIDWADQLTIYAWSLGEEIGNDNTIISIDQGCCKFNPDGEPFMRFANHRCRVSKEYQLKLAERISKAWEAISSGYIFTHLSKEENDALCKELDQRAMGMKSDGTELGDYFASLCQDSDYYSR